MTDLFHYTNRKGLEGILDSKCLWATNYNCLNDRSEVVHLKSILKKTLDPRFSCLIDILYKAILEENPRPPFICSFTTVEPEQSHAELVFREGLLSQWRAYGRNGGFNICFDGEKIKSLLDKQREQKMGLYLKSDMFLNSVFYDESDKWFCAHLQELKDWLSVNIETWLCDKGPREIDEQSVRPFSVGLQLFSRLMVLAKNPAFFEEREVRAVVLRYDDEYIRSKGQSVADNFNISGVHKPHIELFKDSGLVEAIKVITVGPGQSQQAVFDEMRIKYPKIANKFYKCDIPYVEQGI